MFKNGQIIITSNVNKKNLLKKINDKLLNIKIYSINEFNRLYFFDYDEETSYYIMNKYNVKYEIAKIYLDNMTYVEDKLYSNDKLSFLSKLKQDLIDNKLLATNSSGNITNPLNAKKTLNSNIENDDSINEYHINRFIEFLKLYPVQLLNISFSSSVKLLIKLIIESPNTL